MAPRKSPLTLYGLKTCDTCRKALKSLRDTGREVAFHDVRADGLSTTLVERFHAYLGDGLVNRSSATWRGLDDSQRAADPVVLIAAHPTLMKRPVIDDGMQLYLGWKSDVKDALT